MGQTEKQTGPKELSEAFLIIYVRTCIEVYQIKFKAAPAYVPALSLGSPRDHIV